MRYLKLFLLMFLVSFYSCTDHLETDSRRDANLETAKRDVVYPVDDDCNDAICENDIDPTPFQLTEEEESIIKSIIRESIDSGNDQNVYEAVPSRAYKYETDTHIAVSVGIPDDKPYSIFNYVVQLDKDYKLVEQFVVEYLLTPEFAHSLYGSNELLSQFSGTTRYFNVSDFFQNDNGRNDDCSPNQVSCCSSGGTFFNGVFNTGSTSSDTGNSGDGGSGSGNGSTSGSGDGGSSSGSGSTSGSGNGGSGSGSGGGGTSIPWEGECTIVLCGCARHYGGKNGPNCTRCDKPDIVIVLNCNGEQIAGTSSSDTRSSGCCPSISSGFPIVPDTSNGLFGENEDDAPGLNDGINLACVASAYDFAQAYGLPNTTASADMIQNAADCGGCDCGGSTYNDCVATEIVANSPCNSALNDFMTDYGLDLSVEEQMAIVGPGGVSECGEGFEDDVIGVIVGLLGNIEIEQYEYLNSNGVALLEIMNLNSFIPDYKSRMSTSELEIFNSLPNLTQIQFLLNAQVASDVAASLYPQSLYNGIGDAFRHAYFNALNCNTIGCDLAEQLSTAHEDKPPHYEFANKEVEMDLFNNQVGRNFPSIEGIPGVPGQNLVNLIITAINNGELKYLNNLAVPSRRATENSQLIPSNE